MATIHVTMFSATANGSASFYAASPRVAETITSSGSSQATTITALTGETASIVASGGAVWVLAGTSPTAVSGAGYLLPDGGRLELYPMVGGYAIAVKDV
jgi:hypothetical protein